MIFPLPLETLLLLTVTLIVAILTIVHHMRIVRKRHTLHRRPMHALAPIRSALDRGAETGRPIHLSPGSGTIGSRSTTVETVVGLLAAERVATEAALNGAPVLASSGDAVAHLALRGFLHQSYQRAGMGHEYTPSQVQLLAHQDPTAYALGIAALYGRERLEASQMVGAFGQEFLLAGEVGAQRAIPQVAGATGTVALPLMYLTSEGTLIGEEVFAAEAYLARAPEASARLLTHDLLRTVVILALVVLFILAALGIALPV